MNVIEALNLTDIVISDFQPHNVSMDSEKCICVCETSPKNSVVVVNMSMPMQPLRFPITADAALMNPDLTILAHRALLPGTTQDNLQIYDIELKENIKSHQMPEQVSFWKWITAKLLGLVTQTSVYHWFVEGESGPVKMFQRIKELENTQIINYGIDPSEKFMFLIGFGPSSPERPKLRKSHMQIHSVDKNAGQDVEAHAASFATYKLLDNENPALLLSSAKRLNDTGHVTSTLQVMEVGSQPGKTTYRMKVLNMDFTDDICDDFPVAMQISDRYGLIFVITQSGILFCFNLGTAIALFHKRISPHPIFLTSEAPSFGGFYAINKIGQVFLATVNESDMVPYVHRKVVKHFQSLMDEQKYENAAELAVHSPLGSLRTPSTIAKFKSAHSEDGQTKPLLLYFRALLTKVHLNALESLEVSQLVMNRQKILLGSWLADDKLECTEELGDLVKTVDKDLALKIYIKAKANLKVVATFAEQREFDKMLTFCKQVGYTPDYLFLLQTILRSDGQEAVKFAIKMSQMEGGCPVDYNAISDLFLQRNLVQEAADFLLRVLEPDLPEHAFLQTKVFEISLAISRGFAEAILAKKMFSHYDRPRIAQLCEKSGLHFQALMNYEELPDIKRVLVNSHAIGQQSLVDFFGTLSEERALECMKELLLINLKGNLQIVVQVAKNYSEVLGVDSCIKVFEQFKSYEGLYFFLESYLSSSEDPDIHFKYIEAAAKTGMIEDVKRVTREILFYDAEKTKNFLMDVELPDPLINVCDRFGFVPDLTHYLYTSNMHRIIERYVQKVNPGNAPLVVGQLLDDGCPEEFIKGMILSVRFLLPVEPLVEECEKRNRLQLLTQFLTDLVSGGNQDVHVHNAFGKIIIDSNNNPQQFLTTNPYYNTSVVGKYCETRDPSLALIAYRKGRCDDELIKCTNKNSLFKFQARYVVERMDGDLWDKVLNPENEYRQQLIDQVASTALPESKSYEQVHAAVNAFMTANNLNELIELLEKIVLQKSAFSGLSILQSLLIIKAINAAASRVMDYINRLDNFNGPAVGKEPVKAQLYEEAFAIFKKFNLNVQAVDVLLDNIQDIDRALEFASRVKEDAVWSQVAKAQLRKGLVSGAIVSFFHADDATQFLDVIHTAKGGAVKVYHDLIRYLLMVRQKIKRPQVDSELIYAYAKIDRLREMEEFIRKPNLAYLNNVGDRLYDEALYTAAKKVYAYISNWSKLAVTLAKLEQFPGAVDAATKADCAKTWKEVCFACVDAKNFYLAKIRGLNIIVLVDDLVEVIDYYQERQCLTELISLMESGLDSERANMGIFTELGLLYARYDCGKLMGYMKQFSNRLNIPRLLIECDIQDHREELVYLYIQDDDFDNAAKIAMRRKLDTWNHMQFIDIIVKVANVELCYEAVCFYFKEQCELINDVLNVLSLRVDHTRVVDIMREAGDLPLVKPYMVNVQYNNIHAVNEALNDIYVEEKDYVSLRKSVDLHGNFNHLGLAKKIEEHELPGMQKVADFIYKKTGKWKESIALSKKNKLYDDAIETASQSRDTELAEELIHYFSEQGNKECFAKCLSVCHDLTSADVVLQLAGENDMLKIVLPFLLKAMK